MKRLVTTVSYGGLVAIAGDCTKVRPRLAYSSDFGGHILGSTFPLDKCQVSEIEDIDEIIEDILKSKAQATQVQAILVTVCTIVLSIARFVPDLDSRFHCLNTLLKSLRYYLLKATMMQTLYTHS